MSHSQRTDGPRAGGTQFSVVQPELLQILTAGTADRVARWTPPPVEAYEEWHRENGPRRSRHSLTPAQMRRIVIIVRHEGVSAGTASQRLGLGYPRGVQFMKRLPDHLK